MTWFGNEKNCAFKSASRDITSIETKTWLQLLILVLQIQGGCFRFKTFYGNTSRSNYLSVFAQTPTNCCVTWVVWANRATHRKLIQLMVQPAVLRNITSLVFHRLSFIYKLVVRRLFWTINSRNMKENISHVSLCRPFFSCWWFPITSTTGFIHATHQPCGWLVASWVVKWVLDSISYMQLQLEGATL